MHRTALSLALVVLAAGDASADDFLARAVLTPTPAPAAIATAPSRSSLFTLTLGVEGGGAPFLQPPGGPVADTTAHTSGNVFARVKLSLLSSRTIELAWIPRHGYAAMVQLGDLSLGPVTLHVIDAGAVYNAATPVTVSRVTRRWDAALGTGAELALGSHLRLVADARLFAPVDLWGVVTKYGDTARLIGDEVLHGVQLWAGAAYRW